MPSLADLAEQKLDLTDGTGFTDVEIERLIEGAEADSVVVDDDGADLDTGGGKLNRPGIPGGSIA